VTSPLKGIHLNNFRNFAHRQESFSNSHTLFKGRNAVGKTNLFHTYATSNCLEVEEQFAAHYIWIRTFDYSETWVRLGIPTSKYEWTRVRRALNQ